MRLYVSVSSKDKLKVEARVEAIPGAMTEIQHIISTNLEPTVKQAKKAIAKAVHETSVKIKAWALTHLAQAQKLGRRTDLFQKLVNDPLSATNQLAAHLMGFPNTIPDAEEARKVDELLENLKFD